MIEIPRGHLRTAAIRGNRRLERAVTFPQADTVGPDQVENAVIVEIAGQQPTKTTCAYGSCQGRLEGSVAVA